MTEPYIAPYEPPGPPRRGLSTTAIIAIVVGAVVAVVILVAGAAVIALSNDDTSTPAAAVTVTAESSPQPPVTPQTQTAPTSDSAVQAFKDLLQSEVWSKYPYDKQQTVCQGWQLLNHERVIDAFMQGFSTTVISGLQGISDAEIRQAAGEFFDEKCG